MATQTKTAVEGLGGKRARTRAKLLEAAAAIVGEKGFHATTLDAVAQRVGMSRGAIYGNFKNREDLFLALVKERWEPIVPQLKPGGTFREQMQAIGEAVVAAAPLRERRAVGALSFQLYALTHPELRARIAKQNAEIYRQMAAGLAHFIPSKDLPVPAEQFVCVIHALTDGLFFKRFLTPNLITDEVILSAFEMLAPRPAIGEDGRNDARAAVTAPSMFGIPVRMAENKTKPTQLSVTAFVNEIADETKRAGAKTLIKLMQGATGEKPAMWGTAIVGFGKCHYVYESGREGDMPLVGFSPRKAALVLYGAIGFDGADALLSKLGKHTTGKGCLYVKTMSDVDAKILDTLLKKAVAATKAKRQAKS